MAKGFEIQAGKDWLGQAELERQRKLRGGTGELTRGELEQNCSSLCRMLWKHVPAEVGFVLIVAPRNSTEFGVTGSNVEDLEYVEKTLEKAAKRVRRRRVAGDGH